MIKKIDSGILHSNMYFIEENRHAIIIDPCVRGIPVIGFHVDYLIVTHEHYDHISGVNEWKRITGAPLLCSKTCAANIKNSKKNLSRYFDVFCQMQTWVPADEIMIEPVEYYCEADLSFEDYLQFAWQGHKITLMEIPGHSRGSIGIDIDGTDFFSGDSLLEGFQTELRFPGGSAEEWEEIGKKRIEAVSVGTRVWPGHFDGFVKV